MDIRDFTFSVFFFCPCGSDIITGALQRMKKLFVSLFTIWFYAVFFCGVTQASTFNYQAICKNYSDLEMICEHDLEDCENELEDTRDEIDSCNDEISELESIWDSADIWGASKSELDELEGYITEAKESRSKLYTNKVDPIKNTIQSLQSVKLDSILDMSGQTIFSDAKAFLGKVIDLLIKFIGVIALAFLIFGGFRLLVAVGNDNEVQKARSMVTYSIIGLIVALLAYLIVAWVQGIIYK